MGKPKQVDLIGQANPAQRTAWALGAVIKRQRNLGPGHGRAHIRQQGQGSSAQFLGEGNRDPLARSYEVDHAAIASVAAFLQDQALRTHLHTLGLPRAFRHVRGLATLVVDGHDLRAVRFDQIDARHQADAWCRQIHRPGMQHIVFFGHPVRGRQVARFLVDPPVLVSAVHRVRTVSKVALYPFQIGQARTVRIFVQHADRDEIRNIQSRGHRRAPSRDPASPRPLSLLDNNSPMTRRQWRSMAAN